MIDKQAIKFIEEVYGVKVIKLCKLNSISLNENWKLMLEDGKVIVLKKTPYNRKGIQERREIVKILRMNSIDIIDFFFTELSGYIWIFYEYIRGNHFVYRNISHLKQAAKTLKAIHSVKLSSVSSISNNEFLGNPVDYFKNIEFEMTLINNTIDERFAEKLRLFSDLYSNVDIKKIKKCPTVLIHGDYHGKNLVYNYHNEFISILDIDMMGKGFRIMDIAYAAFMLTRNNRGGFTATGETISNFLFYYLDGEYLEDIELELFKMLLTFRIFPKSYYIELLNTNNVEAMNSYIEWSIKALEAIEAIDITALEKFVY